MKYGSLNFMEHSGSLQASNGTAFRNFLTSSYDPLKRLQNYKKQFFYGQKLVLGSRLIVSLRNQIFPHKIILMI